MMVVEAGTKEEAELIGVEKSKVLVTSRETNGWRHSGTAKIVECTEIKDTEMEKRWSKGI